ncbi:MAG: hypothetical protein J6Y54_09480, partial [Lentisphaeria bacterium]|nr:hypothetical protein [Lentisphaeria bacterium]
MPYTNPDGTAKYINNFGINSGGFLVAVSTGAMTDVYAQDLTLLGSGAKFSNCTVSSGGVLSMGSGTTLSKTTMYAGGSMAALATAKLLDCRISGGKVTVAENNYIVSGGTSYSGAEIVGLQSAQYTGVTVKSGGKLTNGNNTFFTNVTFESGATIAYGGAPRFYGSENNIAKGTLGNHPTAYTSGGALYDLTTIGATHFSNIVVSNLDVAGNHYLYASRGTVLRDVALNNGNNAAAPMLFPGVYVYNASAVNANAVLQIHYGKEAASAVTLAGDRTTVNKGGIRYFDESYNKYRVDPDIFIKDGVISGMTLKYGGNTSTTWHLTNLRLAEGIKAQSPVISAGGALFVSSGATVLAPTVSSGGVISAFNGALISGGTFSGTSATTDANLMLHLGSGAEARSVTLKGAFVSATGAVVSGAAVHAGARILAYSGTVISDCVFSGSNGSAQTVRLLHISSGAVARKITLSGALAYASQGGSVNGALVASGGHLWCFDAVDKVGTERPIISCTGVTVQANGDLTVRGVNARGSGIVVSGGSVWIENGASAQDITMSGGNMYISANPGTAMIDSGAAVSVKDLKVIGGTVVVNSGGKIVNANIAAGAIIKFNKDGGNATLQGDRTNIAEGTLYFGNTAVAGHAANGVLAGLVIENAQFSIGDGIVATNAVLNNGSARISAFDGASVDGALVNAGAIICNAGASGTMDNVTLAGGQMNLSGTVKASRTIIENGGTLYVNASTASFDDTILKVGGLISFSAGVGGVDTGKALTLDFAETAGTMNVDLSKLANSTTIYATGVETLGTYALGSGGTITGVTQKWGLYENALVNGGTYDDALNGVTYSFNGTALTTTALSIATGSAAGLSGDNYTALRTNDRAAKWTSGAGTTLVTENFSGDAWVEVAGDLTGAFYGAAVDFANTVNVNAKSGTIRNLAAGAEAGKTVGAVKLTFDGADLAGAGYAGGFGSVTGKTETLINEGSFAKDFYAGALANYAKTGTVTHTGGVTLTIEGGEFSGNIYGAASVKAGAATGLVHSVGNVTITVKDGETTKGAQACLFAGGYATGTAASDTAVYTVNNIDVTIENGT